MERLDKDYRAFCRMRHAVVVHWNELYGLHVLVAAEKNVCSLQERELE